MRIPAGALALSVGLLIASAASAAEKRVTLHVSQMSCATCGPIVQKSLTRLPGVKKVVVSVKSESATVVYDDAKVSLGALLKATTNAGFPSRRS